MPGRLRTSAAGLELIKSFEGFRPNAVRLPDGRWTIGYGHVRTAREGLTINPKDAEDLLVYDLQPVEEAIATSVFAPLMQNQFDALASLVFNISPGQFRESAILTHLNTGDYLAAANGFDLWRKARIHGRLMIVDALVRRRAAEKALFLDHPSGPPSAPTPVLTPELDPMVDPASRAPRMGIASANESEAPDDEPASPRTGPTGEIAEAVRRLAERTQGLVSPASELPLPPGAIVASPEPPKAAPAPAPNAQAAAAAQPVASPAPHVAAERVRRILERREKTSVNGEGGPASAAPAPPQSPVHEGLPDFDAPSAFNPPPPQERARRLIDDTETFDPGRPPEQLFADGERTARIVNGRSKRLGPVSGRIVMQAPWLVVLALSLVGFGIGAANAFNGGSAPSELSRLAPTLIAVFGLMMVVSLYFVFWNRSSTGEGADRG